MNLPKRLSALATVAVTGALVLSGGPAIASAPSMKMPMGYTCTGGPIPSEDYASITVTGDCYVPKDATISVVGNVNVMAGATLDAQSEPSTITIGHNVTAAAGSVLGMGCQPFALTGNSAHPCALEPDGYSTITVHGNVTATGATTVWLNGITVEGNVTLAGGGGSDPWSVKNNMIDGNLTVNGQTVEWLGVLFNTIGKNATLTNITLIDNHPYASGDVYVVRNTVGRNLICMGLVQGATGYLNVVGRNAIGQCAGLA